MKKCKVPIISVDGLFLDTDAKELKLRELSIVVDKISVIREQCVGDYIEDLDVRILEDIPVTYIRTVDGFATVVMGSVEDIERLIERAIKE